MKKLGILLLGTVLGGTAATGAIYHTFPFLIPMTVQMIGGPEMGPYGDPYMPPFPPHFADPGSEEPEAYEPSPIEYRHPDPDQVRQPKTAKRDPAVNSYADTALPAATAGSCDLPPPSSEARMIAVGTYEGSSTNTDVTFSRAANGSATWKIDAKISEGSEPLWLIMSAFEPAIWNFTGAVDRVEHAVLVAGVSDAGAAGLPATKVSVMPRDCFEGQRGPVYFSEVSKSWTVLGSIEEAVGRTTDDIHASYTMDGIMLPEGKVGAKATRYGEAPDIEHMDPATLVLGATATRPDVLPGQAGLAQLIEAGVIRQDRSAHEQYEILQPLEELPLGVRGTFVLGKGMEAPKASHFACITDWRGRPLNGSSLCH